MARQFKFPEKRLKTQTLGCATWCRRRGTPVIILTLACHFGPRCGTPMLKKAKYQGWACHLDAGCGTPATGARKHALWAWHASYVFQRGEEGSPWAWHANCWAWHASSKIQRGI
ncbi:hypothetical protein AHAS_Ahas11G0188800 [Arachis hypogaea]